MALDRAAQAAELLGMGIERLPSHANSRIDELLPHRWKKPDT